MGEIEEDEGMIELAILLAAELGRFPTEDEMIGFIFGTNAVRQQILENK